jgi:hypothetical protein
MFSAPAAPAPIVTNKIPINESIKEIVIGDVNNPTAQVKITKDITLGFMSSNKAFEYNKKLNFNVSDFS